MPAEELRHPHLLRHIMRADPLEDIILGHGSARRQAPAPFGHPFDMGPQFYFGVQQGIAGGAVFGTLVGIAKMFHGTDLRQGMLRSDGAERWHRNEAIFVSSQAGAGWDSRHN